MPQQSFTVTHAQRDTPLVEFLAARMGISRKKAKALLDQRSVFVNQRRVWMAKHIVLAGDRIEVTVEAATPVRRVESSIRILLDDPALLIADKPAGLTADGPDGVEERLRKQIGKATIFAAHRLDQDTTGCLLFAKSVAVKEKLIRIFESGVVTKVYHAIVAGEFSPHLREIKEPIDGKSAETGVIRLSANPAASHLKVRITTGRTHQIRKHMAAAGHPVVGDKMYLTKKQPDPVFRRVTRQMLHASTLAFPHPDTGEAIRAASPLPPDFKHTLRALRLT